MTDVPLPDDLKRELDRRLADIDANPEDEVPWEVVKAEAMADLQQLRRTSADSLDKEPD